MLDWDNDTPPSKEERALEQFLGDLQGRIKDVVEDSEALTRKREAWAQELARQQDWGLRAAPWWEAECPACEGEGAVSEVENGWKIYGVCPWCAGKRTVHLTPGRRGTA